MRRRLSLLPAVAAAATLLVLSGCGGGGGDPTEPDPPAAAPDATTPTGDPDGGGTDGEAGEPGEVPASLAFTGTTVAGAQFDAAELAGEPVMLWFWAPWCPLCHAAAPDVLAAAEQVTVVGVGGLDQDSAMQGFVDRTQTGSLTHLSDPDGVIWQKFEVVSQDRYVLIDAAGEIVHNGRLSGSELRDRAAELAG